MSSIGVNLLWLVPGVVGGSEEHLVRLLRSLPARETDLRLRLYGQGALFECYPDLAERFAAVVAPGSPRWTPAAIAAAGRSKPARIMAEHSWLATASRHDDLVHHAGGVVPAVRSQPAMVTIHDLQPLDLPAHFSVAKRRWLGAMIPYSVRVARLVLCPSAFTARRLRERLGVPAGKIRVVPHGQEPASAPVEARDAEIQALGERFGRYLLLPAIAYPHKRHRDVVSALDLLRDRFGDLSVVVTGRRGPCSDALDRQAARRGLGDRVHQLGRVPEAELDALYRSAVAVVFPSEYEGFGNPVVEAMARGCPVVTSDAGSLPEVAGSAGLVVPVGDPPAIAAAVVRVLEEPGLRAELVRAGREQAGQFSWEAAGRHLAACYRDALHPSQLSWS